MDKYREYIRTFETEVGTLDIIYIFENSSSEVQLWLNKSRIHMPPHVLKQTSSTIVRKVVQTVKSAAKLGVRIGGEL